MTFYDLIFPFMIFFPNHLIPNDLDQFNVLWNSKTFNGILVLITEF